MIVGKAAEQTPAQAEDRVRWYAKRRGYRLEKSRARRSPTRGGYRLRDSISIIVLGGYSYAASLDDVRQYLGMR